MAHRRGMVSEWQGTLLAHDLRPPGKASGYGIIYFPVAIAFSLAMGWVGCLMGVIMVIAGVQHWRVARRYNQTEYLRRLEAWDSEWICLRCGHLFCPGGDERKTI